MTAPRFTKHIAVLRESEVPRRNSVGHADSVEKILGQIALVAAQSVTYEAMSRRSRKVRKVVYEPTVDQILITPSLFRKFICTDGCTACCQKFTLDYTPSEFEQVEHQEGFSTRKVFVNGPGFDIYTNDQNDNPLCDFLRVRRPGGGLGCANYRTAPLSCISAPQLQFIQMRPGKTYVLKKPFGRAWAMTPRPQCQFVEFESEAEFQAEKEMMLSIISRFWDWALYFKIDNHFHAIFNAIAEARMPMTQAEVVWTSA